MQFDLIAGIDLLRVYVQTIRKYGQSNRHIAIDGADTVDVPRKGAVARGEDNVEEGSAEAAIVLAGIQRRRCEEVLGGGEGQEGDQGGAY